MLKSKYIDKICILVMVCALVLTLLFMNGERLGLQKQSLIPGYENRLFDKSYVHSIDIRIDDWQGFLDTATDEQYTNCTIVIDGEKFDNVGLRAKGNNSMSLIDKYNLDRYSLKVEFDHFKYGSYYGLDKLSLDASFQDNSYLKTWIAFDMMNFMGVPTPLCSYTYVKVNGKDWGLFLAIEEPEDAFLRRNYGKNHGKLYKPDYKSLDDENADVALKYIDDNPDNYDNIFRNAKVEITDEDKARLISSLKQLSTGENLSDVIDVDRVIRYFTVQVFVLNLDSYLGPTGHNYYLYEDKGKLSMLPWDYNLAFTTYSLGMPDPVNDAELYVNYPINTPCWKEVMLNRPLYHNIMSVPDNFHLYHEYFNVLISDYFESGRFSNMVDKTVTMISPYVEKDPTAFCSYEDYKSGVYTIKEFCLLRAKSVRGQLDGYLPADFAGQEDFGGEYVDASSIWLPDMGEVEDLKNGYK